MSGPSYQVFLCDPYGSRLADASDFVSLKYTRVVNAVSSVSLVLPGGFNTQLLRIPDGRVEVWRQLSGGASQLVTETTWLIKAIEHQRDEKGRTLILVEADTPLCLFREPGRFVYYAAGDPASDITGPLDDLIKLIARYNAGDLATAARSLSAYLTIQIAQSLAPVGTKQFAWRDCLKVMQELAASSTQAGTYLAFDIVAPTPDTLEFRAYTGQRGVDHRFPNGNNPVIIGPDFGNMGAASIRYDYRNEVTYALAGGRGEGSARVTASSQDTTRTGASPFGLREQFVDATQYETTTGLSSEAQAVVRAGRPRTLFRGKLLDTPDTRYGVHWGWGDFVTVQAFGQSLDCRIDAVSVTVAQGKETIEAVLRNDS